jgi:predicted Fe-Mo cluster-binding NifX family protein
MKMCIPARGPGLDAEVDDRFGRAPYFVFYDTESKEAESIKNPVPGGQDGVGPEAAQILEKNGVKFLVIPRIGGNALFALKAAGIRVLLYEKPGCSVQEAIAAGLKGNLREQSPPTKEETC